MTQKEFDKVHAMAVYMMQGLYSSGDWERVSYTMSVHSKRGLTHSRKLGCINLTTGDIRYTPMLLDDYSDRALNTICHELYHFANPRAKHNTSFELMVSSLERQLTMNCLVNKVNIPSSPILQQIIAKSKTPPKPESKAEPVEVEPEPVERKPMAKPDEPATPRQTYAIRCITWVDVRKHPAFKNLTKQQASDIIADLNKYDQAKFHGVTLIRKGVKRI